MEINYFLKRKIFWRIQENEVIPCINKYLDDNELSNLLGVFLILVNSQYFPQNISSLIDLHENRNNLSPSFSEYEIKGKNTPIL